MPIYEYRCASCGHQLEVLQKVTDPAPVACPACKAENTLGRLVSRTSFQLKGGGWYSDLYASTKKDGAPTDASAPAAAAPAAGATPAAPSAAPASPSSTGSGSASPSSGSSSSGSGSSGGGTSGGAAS